MKMTALLVTVLMLGMPVAGAQVGDQVSVQVPGEDQPTVSYDGFEVNADTPDVGDEDLPDVGLWTDYFGSTVTPQPSGYESGGYADGVLSSFGLQHARLGVGDFGIGPYTFWGDADDSASQDFPEDGATTEIRIYLDTDWASANPGFRVDYTTQLNFADGSHHKDYIFNVETTSDGFDISADNNVHPPDQSGRSIATVADSGWYTFQHVFHDHDGDGIVNADMSVIDSDGNVVATWDTGSDPIDGGSEGDVGNVGYSWFATQEIPQLAIDETKQAQCSSPGEPTCVLPP